MKQYVVVVMGQGTFLAVGAANPDLEVILVDQDHIRDSRVVPVLPIEELSNHAKAVVANLHKEEPIVAKKVEPVAEGGRTCDICYDNYNEKDFHGI